MKKNKKILLILLGPALALLFMFSILPIIISFVISFTDMDLSGMNDISNVDFIGLENYKELMQDEDFWNALQNTLFYVIVGVPILVTIALTLAMAINYVSGKASERFRSIYYLPAITNTVAVAFVWMFIYNYSFGILNYFLSLFGVEAINWLNDPEYAKFALIAMAVWKGIGINMIILLAGLKSIPQDYYEAASIDGAGPIAQFFEITLPQLKFAIFFVIITSIIGWMQFFDEPFIMVEGKLPDTTSIALYIYEQGFSVMDYGYAAAASVVLFIIIISVTAIQMYAQRRSDS